ncbi:S41 family peptidase [Paenibacillus prosopidis]|uniref:Peptidase S41-like protein n=1 Tax=Paenibacillus prosopidis TaxID=630520 RepID=A0A368VIR3_9BACL|nr:S41 family peptidase [Paenibacillus prosopidis]RCW40576.1 peptidase S41-like protein [Paenibacillus prosopidis]
MTSFKLDDGFIKSTVESLADLLLDYYVFPNTAEIMKTALLEKLSEGEFYKEESGLTLAQKITDYVQKISNDKHLVFGFSEPPLPHQLHDPITDENIRLRQKQNNYGFERAERLPGNIGYLVINEFVYPEFAGETAAHAMSFLADTDGLIIDLRNNYGGSSFMVMLIASYLLDGSPPVHLNDLYWRSYDTTQSFWSLPFVPGKRFGASKPVYLLTSRKTGSGAEEFAYSLQAIKRVKIVGEKTGGKANPGSNHRINDHFQVFIPNGRAINPITKDNWEGIGVLPNIESNSDEAYEKAYQLLLQQLLQHFSENSEPGRERLMTDIKQILNLR